VSRINCMTRSISADQSGSGNENVHFFLLR
jgi:hypothetical protein